MPLTEAEIEAAAERGAQRALARLGLHDENAMSDVRELRNLLDSWRAAKRTIGQTILKTATTAFLALIAAGLLHHFGSK